MVRIRRLGGKNIIRKQFFLGFAPARETVINEECNNPLKRYNMKKEKYVKPLLIAKNNPTGSFAAGCPAHNRGVGCSGCTDCERAR